MYRVILIDDEPWILNGLMHAFPWEEHGFEVAGSYMDPEEALDRLLREPVDAVFTDIRMPKLDGIALIQRLREGNRAAEVVIVSGFNEFEYAQQALRLGAFDYILSPSTMPRPAACCPGSGPRWTRKTKRAAACCWSGSRPTRGVTHPLRR